MQPNDIHATGILSQTAPALGVTQWINAAGDLMPDYGLDQMPGLYKVIFCYQDACADCHIKGFPALVKLVEAFRGSRLVSFAAVQTVFKDFAANSFDRVAANQLRYALTIPFGHDAGQAREGAGSVLMQRYRSGGTPWFIVIDPEGLVVYNHFGIDAEKLIAQLNRGEHALRKPTPDASTLTWRGVLALTREGNPAPPRRVELDVAQWRERLTAEQFRITREKGTERAHSSGMCSLFEPGRYACVCCGTELFDASDKFASRSGWPSFTQALMPGVVAYLDDSSDGMTRVETACNVCDAHLGHVFPDGPEPSGLRYCINAAALLKV